MVATWSFSGCGQEFGAEPELEKCMPGSVTPVQGPCAPQTGLGPALFRALCLVWKALLGSGGGLRPLPAGKAEAGTAAMAVPHCDPGLLLGQPS